MPKKLDVGELRLLDADTIPEAVPKTSWHEVFSGIPVGKALEVPSDKASPSTVRQALKRMKAKGKFKRLYSTTRKIDGKFITYVVNPSASSRG